MLNDFVTCAIKKGEIEILSDGKPKRPLVDVLDMCKAINYAIEGWLSKKIKFKFIMLDLQKTIIQFCR